MAEFQRDAAAPVDRAAAVDDWPAQAADTIVRVVGQVRDKTTGPAETAAKAIVYGLLAGLLGTACLVMVAIMAVRILDNYVVGEDNTWLAHLIVGTAFTLAGLYMWSRRRAPEQA
jgi:hypothetical protein